MWGQLAIAGVILAGQWAYHRWFEDKDVPPKKGALFTFPKMNEGDTVPLLYGRTRVRAPVRAWTSYPSYGTNGFSPAVYQLNQFYILGIPMADGRGQNVVWNVWMGDLKFKWSRLGSHPPNTTQTGDGNFEDLIVIDKATPEGEYIGLYMETLNGKPTQELVDASGTPTTWAGLYMTDTGSTPHNPPLPATPDQVPGYRGYLSAMLHGADINGGSQFRIGSGSNVPSYSFEAASYYDKGDYPAVGIYAAIGDDCNPVNVIWDIFVAKFGKLGYPVERMDMASFRAAAMTLYAEAHGYSRSFDEPQSAQDAITEILEQIDGVIFEDPIDGLVKIKLIRPDYDPNGIEHLTKDNIDSIVGLAYGGQTGLPNKIRLVFTDRANDYNEGSAYARNQANAVGQNGIVREITLRMPGIHVRATADVVAARELAARSRSIIKCSAICDRSKIRVRPGDAVKVTYNDPDLAGLIFRVANVNRGTIGDSRIRLDLIQDFFFVYQGGSPQWGSFGTLGDVPQVLHV